MIALESSTFMKISLRVRKVLTVNRFRLTNPLVLMVVFDIILTIHDAKVGCAENPRLQLKVYVKDEVDS